MESLNASCPSTALAATMETSTPVKEKLCKSLPAYFPSETDVIPVAVRNILFFVIDKMETFSNSFTNLERKITNIESSLRKSLETEVSSLEERIDEIFQNKIYALDESVDERIERLQSALLSHVAELDQKPPNRRRSSGSTVSNDDDDVNDEEEPQPQDEDHLTTNEVLHSRILDLEKAFLNFDIRLLECEQYSRRESVIFSGIPDHVHQNQLEPTVIHIIDQMGLSIHPKDISAIHRLGKPNGRYPARVIVKFVNRKIANFCFDNKDVLPSLRDELRMNLRIYESLANLNQEALRICTWLKDNNQIDRHYLRNGYCKIVPNAGGNPVKVPHPSYLRAKFDVPDSIK